MNNQILREDITIYGDVLLNQRNFLLSLKALKTPIFFHFHRFTLRCALEIFFAVNIVLSIMFFVDERSYD